MKTLFKRALGAALLAGAVAAPHTAAAQVNGIATVDLAGAVTSSQALQNGYQQIATQYETQRTTIQQRQQQRQQLILTFDTNGNGQLDEAEAPATQDPNNATVQQIQAIDQEVATLQRPINLARVFVVQQVAQQYAASVQQVMSERNIQLVLEPAAVAFGDADVTSAVVEALNARVPAVNIIPPADYQPSDAAVQLFQQVQQLLTLAILQQQQAAAQQTPAPAAESGR
ncbi:OmpH family outer membrane protein [Aurantiacibacter sediminis]|uniref:OmpH family outer membrane protein n=1 Tax=Aurantiacibacter sediminis TaxID=2793064 RepID=A0ABS0N541_9SPHN|nr:OmpH family outer membrane protein [Aurantiacibacter sediminis]MBH5322903.1 OmpH family outer membrane protein [Aurantiacibacter sediminis]